MITLPWSVLCRDNARHGMMRGRILLTKQYRSSLAAASALTARQWKLPILDGRLHLQITLHEPDKRRRDVGNYVKMLADALTGVVYVDDSQIDHLEMIRGPLDKSNPRADIQVFS